MRISTFFLLPLVASGFTVPQPMLFASAVLGVKQRTQKQQTKRPPSARPPTAARSLVTKQQKKQQPPPTFRSSNRPTLVQEALKNNEPLYYFGLGSNMLRHKLQHRSLDGKPIRILQMGAAVVKGHRLAFNMRGAPPLEPGFGSLEPSNSDNKGLMIEYNEADECHGALVKLTPDDYTRVMASEGVPSKSDGGYEEIVVTAIPYHGAPPVQAIALRARKRLPTDPCPSLRYMTMLRQGAAELGLVPSYQDFLNAHPVQQVPDWLRRVAQYNGMALTLSFKVQQLKFIHQWQNRLLFWTYVPSTTTNSVLKKTLGNLATSLLLLPGALLGFVAFHVQQTVKSILHRVNMLDDTTTKNEQMSSSSTPLSVLAVL